MKVSPLAIDWKFNVMDQSDGFNIKGTLTHFDIDKIAPLSKTVSSCYSQRFYG